MRNIYFILLALALLPSTAWAKDDTLTPAYSEIMTGLRSLTKKQEQQLGRMVLRELNRNYYDLQEQAAPGKIQQWNETLLKKLNSLPLTGESRGRKSGLTTEEIQALYNDGATNPVGDYALVKKYDPEGNIGFCFGRALVMQIEALKHGVAKEAVRKIWAVGSMKYKDIYWQHHVATMVRGTDRAWYVLDPEYDKPLVLEKWVKTVKEMDSDGRLQFFASDGKRWGPADSSAPYPSTLKSDFFNGYFEDLMVESRREAEEIMKEQRSAHGLPAPKSSGTDDDISPKGKNPGAETGGGKGGGN